MRRYSSGNLSAEELAAVKKFLKEAGEEAIRRWDALSPTKKYFAITTVCLGVGMATASAAMGVGCDALLTMADLHIPRPGGTTTPKTQPSTPTTPTTPATTPTTPTTQATTPTTQATTPTTPTTQATTPATPTTEAPDRMTRRQWQQIKRQFQRGDRTPEEYQRYYRQWRCQKANEHCPK